jgi:hypothetical protein
MGRGHNSDRRVYVRGFVFPTSSLSKPADVKSGALVSHQANICLSPEADILLQH